MIDLTKKLLPSSIEAGGRWYGIKTDFRAWIRFSEIIEEEDAMFEDLEWLYEFDVPDDRKAGFEGLMRFFAPKRELPRATGGETRERLIDYRVDGDLIYSAFMERYGIDLVDADLHWHKFLALLDGLHDTKLSDVIGYRGWRKESKKYDAYMSDLKTAWTLPPKLTEREQASVERFKNIFS